MILADENIPHDIIEALRNNDISVHSVYESNRGITDEKVIELSKNPPQIILTEDKDFGEWVFAHNAKSISVIFLRYSFTEQSVITNILVNLIKKEKENLFGLFVTVTTEKIRYRSIK